MVGMIETDVPAPVRMQKVKRLEKPDKKVLEESVQKVNEEIDKLQNRIKEIKGQLDINQQNRNIVSPELLEARNRLAVLNSTFNEHVEEKRRLKAELEIADKVREQSRAEARALRDKLQYSRVEQIDMEIKKLEYKLEHTSVSIKEEKSVLQQLKELKKSKDFVKDYNQKMDHISQEQELRAEAVAKVREKDQLLSDLKVQINEQKKLLNEIREREAAKAIDVPGLVMERNAAYENIKSLREEIKTMKAEFWTKENEYFEREREYREQQAAIQKREFEKRQAEWKEREKLKKQRDMENFVEKYTDEIILCDQLTPYLQKYAPLAEKENNEPLKPEVQAPKGVGNVIPSKKNRNDEELEGWFAGYGSKGKGKKGKAPALSKGLKDKERLSLSLDVLTSFSKLSLVAPLTIGDVNKTLEELKAKRAEFVKLQGEAKAAREKAENGEQVVEASAVVDGAKQDEGDDAEAEESIGGESDIPVAAAVDVAAVADVADVTEEEDEKLEPEVVPELEA